MARGWVYVLTNSSMPGLVKIGRTTRMPQERSFELSGAAGVATPFELVFQLEFPDCARAEAMVHSALDAQHLRVARQREFFRLTPAQAALAILDVATQYAAGRPAEKSHSATTLLAEAERYHFGAKECLQDIGEAVRLYRLAASYGSLVALERLGAIAARPLEYQRSNRRRALAYLRDGAKGGNYYCYVEMAAIYAAEKHVVNFTKSWALFFALRASLELAEVEAGENRYGTALYQYVQQCQVLGVEPAHRAELRAGAESIVHAVVSTLDDLRDAPETRDQLEAVLKWTYAQLLPPPSVPVPSRPMHWLTRWLPQRRRGHGWNGVSLPSEIG